MLESIKIWILNIVTIIIFISFLEILMPSGTMKKYLNLVLGFIVMIVILNPLINILNSNLYLEDKLYGIYQEFNKHEYDFIANNIEMVQQKQLNSLYKEGIKREIENRIESRYEVEVINIDIDLEERDGKYGELKEIRLTLEDKQRNIEGNEIPIVSINITSQEGINDKFIDASLIDKIKEDISKVYNMEELAIIID